jgi:hypothetical protein
MAILTLAKLDDSSMAMTAPQGFAGLMAVRLLLGAAESIVTPAFSLITARFYTVSLWSAA